MQDLGTLAGYEYNAVKPINEAGVITGLAYTAAGGKRAFRWTATGEMQDLGVLPGGT